METLRLSHPTWVRGLKLLKLGEFNIGYVVAPYVGAWIETSSAKCYIYCACSRTLRGCVD